METELSKPREALPLHTVIFDYWKDKAITRDGDVVNLNEADSDAMDVIVDWGEPRCWACGMFIDVEDTPTYQKSVKDGNIKRIYGLAKVRNKLNRCHIVPHMFDGDDKDPGNLFLLCKDCHEKSPDTDDPSNFLRWVYRERNKARTEYGRDVTSIINQVIEECELQGKDPYSGDPHKMKLGYQGNHLSDASIVYGYVATCKPKEDTT